MTKILVVEDEESLATALKEKVVKEGMEGDVARNGELGLELALRKHPDLILLDIIMPVMDGITMLKKLRDDEWGRSVPVIILTSFAQHRGETNIPVSAGFELEAEGYIDKPVSPESLLKQVGAMLKK
jgi:two-component system alkaline phosphatase synthesis response regulator PhoP